MLPVLFELPLPWGSSPIYSFGAMLALGLVLGYRLLLSHGHRREGIDPQVLGNVFLVAVLSGLFGARVMYFVINYGDPDYGSDFFSIQSGGLFLYGGLLGGFAGTAVYARMKQLPLRRLCDAATPSLAIGTFLGRIGCYLYGSDFGSLLGANAPVWLKKLGTFPHWDGKKYGLHGSPAFAWHVDRYNVARTELASLPVHPTQLYEAAFALVMFVLTSLWLKKRAFSGQVFVRYALCYSVFRFAIEYIRDEPERGMAFGYSTTQLCALVLIPVLFIWRVELKKLAA